MASAGAGGLSIGYSTTTDARVARACPASTLRYILGLFEAISKFHDITFDLIAATGNVTIKSIA
ncbi:MAG: hypothetical protein V4723_06405 [Pseudomonadota bacterium]